MKVSLNPELFARHYKQSLQQPSSEIAPKVFLVNDKFNRSLHYKISGIVYCTLIPYDEAWEVYLENFVNNLIVAESVEE